jgi:hypothetical protein
MGRGAWLFVCALAMSAIVRAEEPAGGDKPLAQLTALFDGRFLCNGHFSNGKSISSSESFSSVLGGLWLAEEHIDDPPFGYLARSLWGWNTDGKVFSLTIYDNFGGMRLFTSSGWSNGVLTFDEKTLLAPPARQERFVYKQIARGYSVEYDVLDKTRSWKMGDTLDCLKA